MTQQTSQDSSSFPLTAGATLAITLGSTLLAGWISYRLGLREGGLAVSAPALEVTRFSEVAPSPGDSVVLESLAGGARSQALAQDEREELDRLRLRVAELERRLPADGESGGPEEPGGESARPQTPQEFRAALKALDPDERDMRKARRRAEVELQRRFLELHPDHPEAGMYLTDLSNNLIFLDLDEAYAVLDEFRDKVALPPGELESKQANILMLSHKDEEGIALYEQLTRDPRLSENKQCEYAFWHAYSVQGTGDNAKAAALYHALLDRIGDDVPPSLKRTVGGIHNQLEKIE